MNKAILKLCTLGKQKTVINMISTNQVRKKLYKF